MANESVPLIELRQVSKQFGQAPGGLLQRLGLSRPRPLTRAVDNVDLRIARGEVVGLGNLVCEHCHYHLAVYTPDILPRCPKCGHDQFQRRPFEP